MTRAARMIGVAAALMLASVAVRAQEAAKPVPATPQNVASFLGEWTIAANGSYGPINITVTLTAADGKVTGEASDTNGKHPLSDISKSGTSLVVSYVFDYQGMPIDAIVTLTPGDKKVDAYLDFASGAAQFVGTATKK